jgi:hypothetical protein
MRKKSRVNSLVQLFFKKNRCPSPGQVRRAKTAPPLKSQTAPPDQHRLPTHVALPSPIWRVKDSTPAFRRRKCPRRFSREIRCFATPLAPLPGRMRVWGGIRGFRSYLAPPPANFLLALRAAGSSLPRALAGSMVALRLLLQAANGPHRAVAIT